MSNPVDEAVLIRPMRSEDEAFIFATWLQATRRSTYEARRIRDAVFFPRRHDLYERILRRSTVLVACLAEDQDTILGYVVAESDRSPPVLHFVFVKMTMRRFGIATRLIASAIPDPGACRFTAWTHWRLLVPAPRGTDRDDRAAVQSGRQRAIRDSERSGQSGGDADDLLRKWPTMVYDPDAKWVED